MVRFILIITIFDHEYSIDAGFVKGGYGEGRNFSNGRIIGSINSDRICFAITVLTPVSLTSLKIGCNKSAVRTLHPLPLPAAGWNISEAGLSLPPGV